MNILARYVHGSKDSTDCDVLYIVDHLPVQRDCASFCNSDPLENRNLAVIKNGVIFECYKGFPDEVNNALLATYSLHEQNDPLLIGRSVDRDLPIKFLSVLRKLLMELRHTTLKREARAALKGSFSDKLALAKKTDLRSLKWQISQEELTDRKKSMAFQFGQALALYDGEELYTKQSISDHMPELRPYLLRQPYPMDVLETVQSKFVEILSDMGIEDCGVGTVRIDGRMIRITGKEQTIKKPTNNERTLSGKDEYKG